MSVTYGAGGSTRERTHATVERLVRETDLTPAAHLTCVGASRGEIDDIARSYWDSGVRHIVALRGDPPEPGQPYAPHPQGYANAAELVAGLKKVAPFEISVAAYPEVHPDSDCPDSDLDNLIAKIDAGADRAISQFFFSADNFFRFRDRVAARGVDIEIVPGILPVSNVAQTRKFAGMCGAAIPDWMDRLFEGLDDLARGAPPRRRDDRRRIVRPALCRRGAPVPFLHAQPRRARLRHLPFARSESSMIATAIRAAAAKRILIKDGAYGTQIQAERLQEADYRGDLSLNHDQNGNNDLLNLTRPEIVAGIARRFVAAGADILATNSFNATRISQADYGCEHLVGDINRAAARHHPRGDRRSHREGRQAALGRGRDRPDQQDAVAVARRQRPRLSRSRFRRGEGGLSRAGRRAGRGRGRRDPDRDGVRHAQLQGGDHGRARGGRRRSAASCRS